MNPKEEKYTMDFASELLEAETAFCVIEKEGLTALLVKGNVHELQTMLLMMAVENEEIAKIIQSINCALENPLLVDIAKTAAKLNISKRKEYFRKSKE